MKAKGFYTTRRRKSKEEKCLGQGPGHLFRTLPDRPEEDEDLDEDPEREEDEEREDEE